ncbi:hypothetical protein AB4K20DRAFT_1986903 [Rhizopus microsporus]
MSSNIAEKTTEDVASNPDIEKFSGFAICTTHLHSIFPNYLYACIYNPSLNDKDLKKMLGTVTSHTVMGQSFRILLWPPAKSTFAMVKIDVVNREVTSASLSNRGKYYKDVLKLTLATKQHLNTIISSLHSLTPKKLPSIKLPIVLIVSMNCHISCINLVDKNVYVLQDIYTFNYPKTIKEIKEGVIDDIMIGFLYAHDKIELIRNKKKQKQKSEACSVYIHTVAVVKGEDEVIFCTRSNHLLCFFLGGKTNDISHSNFSGQATISVAEKMVVLMSCGTVWNHDVNSALNIYGIFVYKLKHDNESPPSLQKTFKRLTVFPEFNALSITAVHSLTPR